MQASGVSVVVPAYNEARRILPTLAAVTRWLAQHHVGSEVIVVDDGSTDATVPVVEQWIAEHASSDPSVSLLRQGANIGKGAAVRRGVLEARCELVLFSDADLSTPIDQLERLLAALEQGNEVSIGSRSLADSRVEVSQPFYRVFMGRTFNRLLSVLLLDGFIDTQCGFKLFPREVAHRLFSRARVDGFAFDVEILWLARQQGLRIAEVPVVWRNDEASRVHPVWSSLEMLRDILRIRRLHRRDLPEPRPAPKWN